jgi:hypothetical protein
VSMNEAEQQVVWQIKGIISELPVEQREKVNKAHAQLMAIMNEYGDEGQLAMVLIGAELAAKSVS